ncbi:sensor histidine kinase [Hymenobacter sp. HSC-4F20]|uniref:sensor histidine kinase n=1 Tax=Hymenobacter sp. HSC-4F20 TaxID=2864135 RepID=UPI001C72DBC5|nr:sensor histidine kinase [Hymenobacter sp. HSC-4F20]MBX0291287.1 sensor histidine kinase [Hymenobacter sp. HSC-4F20]
MPRSSARRLLLPTGVLQVPWPHLVWLGLLVYTDAQLWFTRAGLYYQAPENAAEFWRNALLADGVDCALFYLNYLVLQPKLFRARRWLAFLGATVAALLVFAVARVGASVLWQEGVQQGPMSLNLEAHVQLLLAYHLPLGGLILLLSNGLRLADDYLRERESRRELEQQHLRTELSLLKTQLHPHFLFNTLNNIYSLTLQASPQAPEAVLRLAELMRYQLYDSPEDLVPLAREISHLRGFLALQLLRLPPDEADDVLPFTILLPPGAEYARRLPPMLLLPLVENAFKHGDLAARPHVARLHLQVEPEGRLLFQVQNQVAVGGGPGLEAAGGVGLANLHRRLELLYPGQHSLTTAATPEAFCARLEVQL